MSRRERYSIDLDAWPALDRRLWEAARRPAEFLDRPGAAAHWRPTTARLLARSYGLWLFHLDRIGALDPEQQPDQRVTDENLRSFVQSLEDRRLAPVTVASRVTELSRMIAVMLPDADRTLVKLAAQQLGRRQVPSRQKASKVIHSRTIWEGALAYLDGIDAAEAINARVRIIRYRDALIVALLAACPIRMRNLTMIEIGRHLVRVDEGFGCRFAPDETKENRPLSFLLPQELVPYLEHYLDQIRPKLLKGRESARLWVGLRGKPISGQTIYYAVNKMTARLFGHAINPHLFRDCAATSIAIDAPEEIRMTAPLLGHRTPRMSEKHYNQAQMIESSRALQRAVLDLMDPPGG